MHEDGGEAPSLGQNTETHDAAAKTTDDNTKTPKTADDRSASKSRKRDDDFSIDFTKHTKAVKDALESDAKYWRENDAKFRAVNQKVGSYEEFRDIVKASHLKPLEKGDRISDMKHFNQPWNICAKKDDGGSSSEAPLRAESQLTLPQTSLEFKRDWKRQPDSVQKFKYLSLIPMPHLHRLFKNEIDGDLLGEIIAILSEKEDLDYHWTVELLEILSTCDRFSLTVQFMSSVEKQAARNLVKRLETEPGADFSERLGQLTVRYEL